MCANICWFTLNFHGGINTHLHCKYYIEHEQINHICSLLSIWTNFQFFNNVEDEFQLEMLRALKDEKYATSGFEGWLWETFFFLYHNNRINPQKHWHSFSLSLCLCSPVGNLSRFSSTLNKLNMEGTFHTFILFTYFLTYFFTFSWYYSLFFFYSFIPYFSLALSLSISFLLSLNIFILMTSFLIGFLYSIFHKHNKNNFPLSHFKAHKSILIALSRALACREREKEKSL